MSDGAAREATPMSHWWADALVYQVYVRSFADSDGNGIGDLDGITAHLDHIAALGADAIWLNPCYPSPQRDHGYDVSDYTAIHDEYGSLETFDRLVAEARARGIRVIMDVVPNHCSSEHPWFLAALAAPPGSPERARFYFRDGRGAGGAEPPNNWQAAFGGPAWSRVDDDPEDGQWYLGTFTPHQPDFDHTNPDVQQLFADTLRFWFDRGVEGFRVDAITPVGKHPELPDQPPVERAVRQLGATWENPYLAFREEGHAVWRRWRRVLATYEQEHPGRDLVLVGEAYAVGQPDVLTRFTQSDQFRQMFAFDLTLAPWDKRMLERAIGDPLGVLTASGVAPAWTLNNHDVQRIVTRLGRADAHLPERWTNSGLDVTDAPVDLALGTRRARAAAALAFALPGSLYLYQGEELGLPEVLDVPDDRREDPVFALTGGEVIGRDGCRIPLPWTADPATSYGFSPASPEGVADPWLPQPDGWGDYSLETQLGAADSVLGLYGELSRARREHAVPQGMAAGLVDLDERLVALARGGLIVILNPTDGPVALDPRHEALAGARPVLSSAPGEMHTPAVVPADTTVWLVR
jgi:alpha-glucosidase